MEYCICVMLRYIYVLEYLYFEHVSYCNMNYVLCDVFYVVVWLVFMFRVCVVFVFVCMCERGI